MITSIKYLFNYKLKKVIKFGILPGFLIYTFIIIVFKSKGYDLAFIIKDVAQTCKVPSSIGLLSNLGILIWASAASICFFSVLTGLISSRKLQVKLALEGLLSLVLCLDDLLLIHDRYINEKLLYLFYFIVIMTLIVVYSKLIIEMNLYILITPLLFFCLSIAIDLFPQITPFKYNFSQVLEEGFKFIGITCWLFYCYTSSTYSIRKHSKPDTMIKGLDNI